jgi:hypothetical protein
MKKIIITAVIILSFAVRAFADTSIKAEVDKASLTTDDEITYKIIVTSSEKNLPAPQPPEFTGFSILSQAHSSTVSFVSNEVKTILVYAFILAPTQTGKFKIKPASIKIKNQVFSSDAFEVEVTQGKEKPKTPFEQKPSLPEEFPSESKEPQITL